MKKKRTISKTNVIQTLCLLLFGLLFVTPTNAQLSGKLTVDPSSSTGGTNYQSIQELADALAKMGVNGPVYVDVSPGTYKESVDFQSIKGVSGANTVTIDGGDSSKTILTYSGSTTLKLDKTTYLKFRNMTVENTSSSSGYAVILTDESNYNSFKSCIIQTPYATTTLVIPFQISGGTYSKYGNHGNFDTLYNCLLSGGYVCVNINGKSSLTGAANKAYGNAIIDCHISDYYYYGIRGYYVMDNLYKGNNIEQSLNATTGYGMYCYYSDSTIIDANTLRIAYMGIYTYRNEGSKVQNNFVICNGKYPNGFYGLYIYYNTGSDVFHNTVYDISTYTSGYTVYFYGNTNVRFENNILYKVSTGRTHLYIYNATNCYLDYNLYYNTGGSFINFQGTVYNDLSSYQSAINASLPGSAQHSIFVDPQFTDLTLHAEDLHIDPKVIAPSGKWVGVEKDVDGDARCEFAPTIGADESFTGKTNSVVKFYLPQHVYANAFSTITNSAKEGEPKRHEWYINGVKVSDSVVLYTNLFGGPKDHLKLVTYSCAGKDSFEADVKVESPSAKPVTNFVSSENIIAQNESVKFFDLSTNGPTTWTWSISPDVTYVNYIKTDRYEYIGGSSSTPNPVVRFEIPGRYRVCLTTSNGVGTASPLCKVDYITVLPSVNMGSVKVVNDSSGHLYDDGGPYNKYSNNASQSLLIAPCASEVSIAFKNFDLECGGDFLRIYDGVDNSGTQLNSCKPLGFTGGPASTGCNSYCPPSQYDTFTAKSGSLFIEFISNSSDNLDGFSAEWWSKPAKNVAAPIADFDLPDSFCAGQPIQITNTSTGASLQYMWELDEDSSTIESNDENPFWAYFFPGKVKITLVAYNCGGSDTLTKEVTIFDPSKPKAKFVTDNATPTPSDIVSLSRVGKNCVNTIRWTIFKTSDPSIKPLFVGGTSMYSNIPKLSFKDTGCYTVKLYVENDEGKDSVTQSCAIRVKADYCKPSVANLVKDISISNVTFHTINNTSQQAADEYSNYTPSISTTIELGLSYPITIKRTSNSNAVTRTVWVDWNADGDFNDPGEKAAENVNSTTLSWTGSINVPISAKLGATVMRVAINIGTEDNQVCGQNLYGEYEDYRLYITTDKTAPVITLMGSDTVTIEQGETFTDPGYSASDNTDGNITKNVKIDKYDMNDPKVKFAELVPGTYYFDYNVKDAAGNPAEEQRRVVIVLIDKSTPILYIALPDTVQQEVFSKLDVPELFSATDLVDGDVTGFVVTDILKVNMNKLGIYPITYSVSDVSGNKAVEYRWIWVVDTKAPTMTLTGSSTINHEVNTPYVDLGVTYSDNYDSQNDLDSKLIIDGQVDVNKPGVYTISYSLTDNSGNGPVTVVRNINVSDNTSPVVTLMGDSIITMDVNTTYNDPGFTAKDNYTKDISVVKGGTFYSTFSNGYANQLGTFTITYTATDSASNMTTVTRTINVADVKAPVITLKGEPSADVCRWKTYTDEGYDLSDNFWDIKDITVTEEGSIISEGTDKPGNHSLRYKAVDGSGNVSYSKWRRVFVLTPEQCGNTSIENISNNKSVNVYPNPGSGLFYIQFINNVEKVQSIRVVNLLGQQVGNIQLTDINNSTMSINMDNQPAGVYLIHITTPKGTIIKQIVLTR